MRSIVWQLIAQAVLLPPLSLPLFHCFYSVTGACSPYCVGAHGWVARICQPWEQSSSRSWLPIVEAPGYFRHPTSILAMQLLMCSIPTKGIIIFSQSVIFKPPVFHPVINMDTGELDVKRAFPKWRYQEWLCYLFIRQV